MKPPEFDVAMRTSLPVAAFSNGHEGETWQRAWCGTCRFNDQSEAGDGCDLVMVALMGRTPAEWEPDLPGGLIRRYSCSPYEPADGDVDVREHIASLKAKGAETGI